MVDPLIDLWFRMREPQQAEHVRAWAINIIMRSIIYTRKLIHEGRQDEA